MTLKNITNAQRAEILTQALPYIRKYYNKTVVVKYGGNAMTDETLKAQVMEDIVLLSLVGVRIVLVHGGGPDITDMLSKIGKKSEFIDGLRVTDKESMDVVQMVLAGKVNKTLVNYLESRGGKAMGISGMDGHMIDAGMKDDRLGYVGKINAINVSPITDLLNAGYIPVVSTVGCDWDGNAYNINADTVAARIAGALGAECLITMTNVAGVLRDKDDLKSLIPSLTVSQTAKLFEEGVIVGGMVPKLDCCVEAILSGVKKVFIMDGRIPHSILVEMLTDEGAGTMVTGDDYNDDEGN
jgi:acetylglutamate kinase